MILVITLFCVRLVAYIKNAQVILLKGIVFPICASFTLPSAYLRSVQVLNKKYVGEQLLWKKKVMWFESLLIAHLFLHWNPSLFLYLVSWTSYFLLVFWYTLRETTTQFSVIFDYLMRKTWIFENACVKDAFRFISIVVLQFNCSLSSTDDRAEGKLRRHYCT